MENTFVVNDEPIMIKITIEVIPSKKKEDVKEVPVVVPTPVAARQTNSPEGWDAIEPENPTVVPPIEPIAPPEKKKRAYTRKAKITEEPPVEEKKPELVIDEKPAEAVPTKVDVKPAPTTNKVVARLAQMIRFYCKVSNISTEGITKKYLIEHGASDIFEGIPGITDEMIDQAIKEANKK